MCSSGGLAGGFVSHKAGQMLAGNGSSNPRPPRPMQPVEPLKAELVSEPVVNTGTLDQETALKQKKLNQTKARPVGLHNTGLHIGGMDVKSK